MGLTVSSSTGPLVLIEDKLLASAAASFDFTSIPGTFRALQLFVVARSNVAAQTFDAIILRFNGDTAANYDQQRLYATGSTPASSAAVATASPVISGITGSTAPANSAGHAQITIFDYASTVFNKMAKGVGGAALTTATTGIQTETDMVHWRSTAAITQVTLSLAGASNFITGSRATLYGIT